MNKAVVIDISTQVTEEDLRKLSLENTQGPESPKSLDISRIHVADQFFQRRDMEENRVEHDVHIRELIRCLRDTQKAFGNPLVVMWIGDRYWLIDGHYRLMAYRSVGWSRKVPVSVFTGDLDAAWRESLRLNVRNKRPMSLADKAEAAWNMTRRGMYTKAVIAEACSVSAGTVRNMRKRLAEMRETGENPAEFSWKQAKHGKPKERLEEDDWLDKYATEWAERFVKGWGSKPRERPDILAAMLFKVDAGLPRALMAEWRGELRELIEEWDAEEETSPF